MITKKELNEVAELIRNLRAENRRNADSRAISAVLDVQMGLARIFKQSNPRFDEGRFHVACDPDPRWKDVQAS